MLSVMDISKKFGKNMAVRNVTMELRKGETVGLLGPNGAGKSTAISIISSLLSPTSGDVQLDGKSIVKNPALIRQKIGVVPQEIALYMELTAGENLEFFARIQKIPKNIREQRINHVLQLIGLSDKRDEIVKNFSGGMKRRLNIGAALLHNPEIIIMDEPTVGIDTQSRKFILESVKKMTIESNITVLYTSHYMEEVDFLCNRIYIMDQGEIIASGKKEELKAMLASDQSIVMATELVTEPFLAALKAHPAIKRVSEIEGKVIVIVSKEINILKDLFKAAEETSTIILSLQVQSPTLEDVFLHLTGRQLRD